MAIEQASTPRAQPPTGLLLVFGGTLGGLGWIYQAVGPDLALGAPGNPSNAAVVVSALLLAMGAGTSMVSSSLLGGALGRSGAALAALGFLVMFVALLNVVVDYEPGLFGNFEGLIFAGLGLIGAVLGSVLVGLALVRSRGVARVAGTSLLVGPGPALVIGLNQSGPGIYIAAVVISLCWAVVGWLVARPPEVISQVASNRVGLDGEAGDQAGSTTLGTLWVRRRPRNRVLATGLVVGLTVLLIAIRAVVPSCASGRLCVPAAGISLALPEHWASQTPKGTELLVASSSDDPSVEIVVERGIDLVDAAQPMTIDEVEASAMAALNDQGAGFSRINDPVSDRETLPIGEGVRIRFTSTTAFILTSNQATTAHWFIVGGQVIVLEYLEAYGEGPAEFPGVDDPSALRAVLASLEVLKP